MKNALKIKRKKLKLTTLGFTLIELLAVIVILAIIALIAVPIVLNIINDAKKESMQRSMDLYMDTVHKRITQESMKIKYDPDRCDILENGNVKCYSEETTLKTSTGEDELIIEMNGKKPESGTITIVNNKISYENVYLESIFYHMDESGKKSTTSEKKLQEALETEDYRGYYADIDGNGTVDGIIYADLAHSSRENASWEGYNYSYKAKTNLNKYTVSKDDFNVTNFGTKKVVKLATNKEKPRFYIMALENFTTEEYTKFYWHSEANNFATAITTFGSGKENTENLITRWNEMDTNYKNNQDIWNNIQEEYEKGWWVPSSEEWAAFGDYFASKIDIPLTGNYWTSSDGDTYEGWVADFNYLLIHPDYLGSLNFLRLTTEF